MMTYVKRWPIIACLTVMVLMVSSCQPIANATADNYTVAAEGQVSISQTGFGANMTETILPVVTANTSRYGGTISIVLDDEPAWDLFSLVPSAPLLLVHQRLFDGDWMAGNAGGYGKGLTDWSANTNIPEWNTGYLAEAIYWQVSDDGSEITTTFRMRDGVHFARVDTFEGRYIDGREVTLEDLIWNWNQRIQNEYAQNYQLYPEQRYPIAKKTSDNTFTVTHEYEDYFTAMARQNCSTVIFPPELWEAFRYHTCITWELSIGTGPYMITSYVSETMVTLSKNPEYWMKDPAGPEEGSQLPYADKVKYFIIKDSATREAALRTATVDRITFVGSKETEELLADIPELLSASGGFQASNPLFMRTDIPPFNDIGVRQALLLATDFERIKDDLYEGLGEIISWPYLKTAGYEPLAVGMNDSDLPLATRELYTYDPVYAGYLLSSAGYPEGFSTTLVLQESDVSYYEKITAMWRSVGIDVTMQVKDFGSIVSLAVTGGHDGLIVLNQEPISSFPEQRSFSAHNWLNASRINDPYVFDTAERIRDLAVQDLSASMDESRSLIMYLLDKAYVVPAAAYPVTTIWWPWLRNYSGEVSVGYFSGDSWVQWVWIDRSLKTAMGY